jgi:hypothetical protein
MADLAAPYADPSLYPDYLDQQRKQMIAGMLMNALQQGGQAPPQWDQMRAVPRMSPLSGIVAPLAEGLMAGRALNSANTAQRGYFQKLYGDSSSPPASAPSPPQSGASTLLNALSPPPGGAAPPSVSPLLATPPDAAPTSPAPPGMPVPPTRAQIAQTSVGGLSPRVARQLAFQSQDPLKGLETLENSQLTDTQRQYQPVIAALDSAIHSGAPARAVAASPLLQSVVRQQAPAADMQDDVQVTRALLTYRNDLAGHLSQPTIGPPDLFESTTTPLGGVAQRNRFNNEEKMAVPNQPVEHVLGSNGQAYNTTAAGSLGKTPYMPTTLLQQQSNSPAGQLVAGMAARNISFPAGTRTPQQELLVAQNILRANPGASIDQLVDQIGSDQMDFNGRRRSVQQLATLKDAANAGALQLEKNFKALEPLVTKMDATGVPIINRLVGQWQQGVAGDKDTAAYMTYLKAVAGEYAKIRSGATGGVGASDTQLKEATDLMNNAFSQGGYQGLREALTTEAANKRDSYMEALRQASARGAAVGAAPPPASPGRAASGAPAAAKPQAPASAKPPGTGLSDADLLKKWGQ